MTMKITRLETIWLDEQPNTTWVRIHTDDGLIGLGETFYVPRAISAMVHDVFANLLIGRSAFDIESHWQNMFYTVNFFGYGGSETRAISAVDVALWDLLGQYTGQPIYNLLGGRCRDSIWVYNTCVGHGKHQDYKRWSEGGSGALAEELLEHGRQSHEDLALRPIWRAFGWTRWSARGLGPLGLWVITSSAKTSKRASPMLRISATLLATRSKSASKVMRGWDLTESTKIAHALEPYDIMWLEEIMPPDNIESYSRLKHDTTIPLCVSERLISKFGFREVIEKNAADIIMPDMAWCGGISETRKICHMAETYLLPITSHDCIGPVALWSAAHLMLHIPNAMIMETVRAYYDGWYNEVMTQPLAIREGMITLSDRPGLGTALRDEVLNRPDAHMEYSDEKHRIDMSKG